MATDPTKNNAEPDNLLMKADIGPMAGHPVVAQGDTHPAEPADAGKKIGSTAPRATDGPQTNIKNILGFYEIVSAAPTAVPKNIYQQIKLYVNGATFRIYFYDYKAGAWRFV